MRIFLIGYMGCGKSSLGRPLARLFNMPFVDLDIVIEREYGMSVSSVFEQYGEAFFRKAESCELQKLCDTMPDAIISVGGGTPCFEDNMTFMKKSGTTVFIDINVGILVSRLIQSKKQRPLLAGKTEQELARFVESSLEQRLPIYQQSHITVSSKNLNAADLYNVIMHSETQITTKGEI